MTDSHEYKEKTIKNKALNNNFKKNQTKNQEKTTENLNKAQILTHNGGGKSDLKQIWEEKKHFPGQVQTFWVFQLPLRNAKSKNKKEAS